MPAPPPGGVTALRPMATGRPHRTAVVTKATLRAADRVDVKLKPQLEPGLDERQTSARATIASLSQYVPSAGFRARQRRRAFIHHARHGADGVERHRGRLRRQTSHDVDLQRRQAFRRRSSLARTCRRRATCECRRASQRDDHDRAMGLLDHDQAARRERRAGGADTQCRPAIAHSRRPLQAAHSPQLLGGAPVTADQDDACGSWHVRATSPSAGSGSVAVAPRKRPAAARWATLIVLSGGHSSCSP